MEQFIETYKEIGDSKSLNLRSTIRSLILSGLTIVDKIAGIEKYLNTPRIQFIYIHHSFKDELHHLDNLLNRLSKNHVFISHTEAVRRILENNIDKPYISFSSDDGFKNNLFAAEILNNHGAKACFFINPGLIEEYNFDKINQHCRNKLHLPPIEFLNWKDVEKLKNQGHEIGAHTMFHDNIVKMSQDELDIDMQQTFAIISARCGEVKHFAFPYGRFSHFNEIGRKAVFDAGFLSCASAERGCHINDNSIVYNQLCIRRDHVILDWPINHILHFLVNNVKKSSFLNRSFPYSS